MKHPGASGVDIPGLHPHDTGTRRAHPPSSYPDIPTAGPTLVSADPDISWSRRDTNHTYSHGRRWGNTNHCRLRGSDKSAQEQNWAKSSASVVHFIISVSLIN